MRKNILLATICLTVSGCLHAQFNAQEQVRSENETFRADTATSNHLLKTGTTGSEETPMKYCFVTSDPVGNPDWDNGINKIYSDCPQVNVGIGTGNPQHRLHVYGRGVFTDNFAIGTDPHDDVQLNARTKKKVGLCLQHDYTGTFGYGVKTLVRSAQTKGVGVYNTVLNQDVATLYGNGDFLSKGHVSIGNVSGVVNTTALHVETATTDNVAMHLNSNYTAPWGYGTLIDFENDRFKPFAARNKDGEEIFVVTGEGKVWATEVEVKLPPFPDYVFSSDYALMSLEQVQAFIAKEKHLPAVPSAQEIDANGIGVSQLLTIQMEKIEELTLHLIDLNERLKALEAENQALKGGN